MDDSIFDPDINISADSELADDPSEWLRLLAQSDRDHAAWKARHAELKARGRELQDHSQRAVPAAGQVACDVLGLQGEVRAAVLSLFDAQNGGDPNRITMAQMAVDAANDAAARRAVELETAWCELAREARRCAEIELSRRESDAARSAAAAAGRLTARRRRIVHAGRGSLAPPDGDDSANPPPFAALWGSPAHAPATSAHAQKAVSR